MGLGSFIRLYRPPCLDPFVDAYVFVYIDGINVGELWNRQVLLFGVSPGTHRVRLRSPYSFPVGGRSYSIASGETLELASWSPWTGGFSYFMHPVTPREKRQMAKLQTPTFPPRNLGASEL